MSDPRETQRFPSESERLKRAKLIELLDDGLVSLGVWPGADGVEMPEHLRALPIVKLHISRTFGHAVLDLGPFALRVTLSFNREPFECVIPWGAIWNMRAGESSAGPTPSPCPHCGEMPRALRDTDGTLLGLGCVNHQAFIFRAASGLVCDFVAAWEEGAQGSTPEPLDGATGGNGAPSGADVN